MTTDLARHVASQRHNPSRGALACVLGFALACAACASQPTAPLPETTLLAGPDNGALEVRLVFGGAADLDLFVTDPSQETVYFGNNPSRAGGKLLADLRCDATPPRTETIVFRRPTPGPYRIGVNHAARCGGRRGPIAYRVEAARGATIWRAEGTLAPGHFASNALRFTLPRPPDPAPEN